MGGGTDGFTARDTVSFKLIKGDGSVEESESSNPQLSNEERKKKEALLLLLLAMANSVKKDLEKEVN